MGKIRQLFSILLAAAILTTCALAQSNLTQIRDTIYNSDGTPFNGTVVITWVGFSSGSSSTVSPLSTSARIYNGALSVLLVPSTTASAGSYYQVVYYSNDGTTTWTETWSVPVSTTALTVSAVRTSTTSGSGSSGTSGGSGSSSGSSQYATLPIAITSITGLSDDLNTINGSISSLTTSLNGISSMVTTQGASITTNSNSIATLNTTVAGLSSTATTQASTISGLSSSVSSLNTSVTTLSNTVSSLQSGSGTLSVAFVDGETPVGIANGSNATFTLSQTPSPVTSLQLYRNGLLQTSGVDFTLSGSTITFLPIAIPLTGDILQAHYRVTGSSAVPAFADDETPAGTINGSNLSFTLQYAPNPATSLMLYKNGVLMQQSGDYSVSGSTATFVSASAPQTGDSLTAYYRH